MASRRARPKACAMVTGLAATVVIGPSRPPRRRELQQLLTEGHDVVVDHGFWTSEERGQWAATVREAGGKPMLVYLPAPHEVRWERVRKRNEQSLVDPNSIEFSEEDMLRHARRFEPPTDDEPHITFNGHVEDLVAALQRNPNTDHDGLPPG
ncbi:AAA family ATPase, partial [Streptomyces sp. NPDC001939]